MALAEHSAAGALLRPMLEGLGREQASHREGPGGNPRASEENDNPSDDYELLLSCGFCNPQSHLAWTRCNHVLGALGRLRVFDTLAAPVKLSSTDASKDRQETKDGSAVWTAAELAEEIDCDAVNLYRLLRACVVMHLLRDDSTVTPASAGDDDSKGEKGSGGVSCNAVLTRGFSITPFGRLLTVRKETNV
eukprot:gene18828-25374_t